MPIIKIVKYPHPILLKKSEDISLEDIKLKKYESVIENMKDAILTNNAVGIAAPQIGLSLSIIVYYDSKKNLKTVINPVIIARSGNATSYNEQCLSCPKVKKDVRRSRTVVVKGFDAEGNQELIKERKKFTSFTIQHEIDHLNGITLINK